MGKSNPMKRGAHYHLKHTCPRLWKASQNLFLAQLHHPFIGMFAT
jgi:hypothetical protein